MKKLLLVAASIILSVVFVFSGCTAARDGRDGKDGKDVSIQEIYEKYVEEYGEISYSDFLLKYLNYSNEQLDAAAGVQSSINKSLMASVSILTRFEYSSKNSLRPSIFNSSSYKVYTGSGVILWIDREAGDAYVVTNCHVVYDDTSLYSYCGDIRLYLYGQDVNGVNYIVDDSGDITDDDNYRIDAEVIGASVTYDIALLKVTGSEVLKRSDAVAATFSQSDDVYTGEYVYAVGNAAGEGLSASEGIISKDSEFITLSLSDSDSSQTAEYRVMRTSAAVNHGNSGGGLFNADGEIVGIINSKDDSSETDNMGYALPSSGVRRLLALMYDSYAESGKFEAGIEKALINIQYEISDSYARFDEITGLAEITEVMKIIKVTGSPAQGQLQVGDYIENIKVVSSDGTVKEDKTVTRRYHVTDVLFSVRLNDTVIVTVERNGEQCEVALNFNSTKYFSYYS